MRPLLNAAGDRWRMVNGIPISQPFTRVASCLIHLCCLYRQSTRKNVQFLIYFYWLVELQIWFINTWFYCLTNWLSDIDLTIVTKKFHPSSTNYHRCGLELKETTFNKVIKNDSFCCLHSVRKVFSQTELLITGWAMEFEWEEENVFISLEGLLDYRELYGIHNWPQLKLMLIVSLFSIVNKICYRVVIIMVIVIRNFLKSFSDSITSRSDHCWIGQTISYSFKDLNVNIIFTINHNLSTVLNGMYISFIRCYYRSRRIHRNIQYILRIL